MFTTGDLIEWNQVPERVRDLARRYFLTYPERLRRTADEEQAREDHSKPFITLESGQRFRDRRRARGTSPTGGEAP